MISLEKLNIFTPLKKLPNNIGDLGKLIVAKGFKSCPMSKKLPDLVKLVPTHYAIHRPLSAFLNYLYFVSKSTDKHQTYLPIGYSVIIMGWILKWQGKR